MVLSAISDSSNVVASGYEDGLLRIVFSDGAIYDAEGIPPEINAAFLASESKGSFVHQWLKDKLAPVGSTKNQSIKLREPEPAKPLNSHDADPCCGRLIGEALRKGELDYAAEWNCPKCSMQWKRVDIGKIARNWQPHPYVASVPLLKR